MKICLAYIIPFDRPPTLAIIIVILNSNIDDIIIYTGIFDPISQCPCDGRTFRWSGNDGIGQRGGRAVLAARHSIARSRGSRPGIFDLRAAIILRQTVDRGFPTVLRVQRRGLAVGQGRCHAVRTAAVLVVVVVPGNLYDRGNRFGRLAAAGLGRLAAAGLGRLTVAGLGRAAAAAAAVPGTDDGFKRRSRSRSGRSRLLFPVQLHNHFRALRGGFALPGLFHGNVDLVLVDDLRHAVPGQLALNLAVRSDDGITGGQAPQVRLHKGIAGALRQAFDDDILLIVQGERSAGSGVALILLARSKRQAVVRAGHLQGRGLFARERATGGRFFPVLAPQIDHEVESLIHSVRVLNRLFEGQTRLGKVVMHNYLRGRARADRAVTVDRVHMVVDLRLGGFDLGNGIGRPFRQVGDGDGAVRTHQHQRFAVFIEVHCRFVILLAGRRERLVLYLRRSVVYQLHFKGEPGELVLDGGIVKDLLQLQHANLWRALDVVDGDVQRLALVGVVGVNLVAIPVHPLGDDGAAEDAAQAVRVRPGRQDDARARLAGVEQGRRYFVLAVSIYAVGAEQVEQHLRGILLAAAAKVTFERLAVQLHHRAERILIHRYVDDDEPAVVLEAEALFGNLRRLDVDHANGRAVLFPRQQMRQFAQLYHIAVDVIALIQRVRAVHIGTNGVFALDSINPINGRLLVREDHQGYALALAQHGTEIRIGIILNRAEIVHVAVFDEPGFRGAESRGNTAYDAGRVLINLFVADYFGDGIGAGFQIIKLNLQYALGVGRPRLSSHLLAVLLQDDLDVPAGHDGRAIRIREYLLDLQNVYPGII